MDLIVIACIKRWYKKREVKRAVDLFENSERENLYKIDIKLAGLWISSIWSTCRTILSLTVGAKQR